MIGCVVCPVGAFFSVGAICFDGGDGGDDDCTVVGNLI